MSCIRLNWGLGGGLGFIIGGGFEDSRLCWWIAQWGSLPLYWEFGIEERPGARDTHGCFRK